MLSVFDWILNVMNETVNDWMNEWMSYQLYFYVMNVMFELPIMYCLYYVINGCVTELYFRRVLFRLGKNVMDKWYEWLCDWFLFQETISTSMNGMTDCVIGVIVSVFSLLVYFNHLTDLSI